MVRGSAARATHESWERLGDFKVGGGSGSWLPVHVLESLLGGPATASRCASELRRLVGMANAEPTRTAMIMETMTIFFMEAMVEGGGRVGGITQCVLDVFWMCRVRYWNSNYEATIIK